MDHDGCHRSTLSSSSSESSLDQAIEKCETSSSNFDSESENEDETEDAGSSSCTNKSFQYHSSSSESESDEEEYIETFQDEEDSKPIFHGSSITILEAALLIFSFIIRHCLSGTAVDDLLKLITTLSPCGSAVPSTRHYLKKIIKCDYKLAKVHYYCPSCLKYLDSTLVCKTRLYEGAKYKEQQLLKINSFFVSFPLDEVISDKMRNEQVRKSVSSTIMKRETSSSSSINDIVDGKMYKDLNLQKFDITCTFNSDGVPAFKSSNTSVYPLLISINEAEYKVRRKHTMTAAVWFGSGKPSFNTFFTPFVDDAVKLSKKGISWNYEDKLVQGKVYFPLCLADSVARCVIQGLHQFNGVYGCPWCLEKGFSFKLPNGKSKRIYQPLPISKINLRTEEGFKSHLKKLAEKKKNGEKIKHYKGVKKASILLKIPKFNIVKGFAFDYMHQILLGVCRRITNLWIDPTFKKQPFYIKSKKQRLIDADLLKITSPNEIPRATRSLDHRRFWKSSEWKSWLFVAPHILRPHLEQSFYDHFCLLSESTYILCSANLTETEIKRAEKKIAKFVKGVKLLYGETHCSSNLHLLLHAAECVRNWGPLFAYSAFQFENYNQIILSSFNNAMLVAKQVSNRICERFSVETAALGTTFSWSGMEFYNSQMYNIRQGMKYEKVGEAKLLGRGLTHMLSMDEVPAFKEQGHFSPFVEIYKSVRIGGMIFDAKTHTQRCNNIVQAGNKLYVLKNVYVGSTSSEKISLGEVNEIRFSKVSFNEYSVHGITESSILLDLNSMERVKFFCMKEEDKLLVVIRLANYEEVE